jgi:hypothetical protein
MTESTMAADLVAALGKIQNPKKDAAAKAGAYSYSWATLPQILDLARPVLAEHHLAITFEQNLTDGLLSVSAVLLHTTGESHYTGPMVVRASGDMQQVGSQSSYLRRYLTLAALGIAADDDDDAQSVKHIPVAPEPREHPGMVPVPAGLSGPAAAGYASSTELARPAQFGKIVGELKDRHGIHDRGDVFAIVSGLVFDQFGVQMTDSKELLKTHASFCITEIEKAEPGSLSRYLDEPPLDYLPDDDIQALGEDHAAGGPR